MEFLFALADADADHFEGCHIRTKYYRNRGFMARESRAVMLLSALAARVRLSRMEASMSDEKARGKADLDAAIAHHGADDPAHTPPDPAKDGKVSLDAAKEYSAQIKGSMFSNRNAPKS